MKPMVLTHPAETALSHRPRSWRSTPWSWTRRRPGAMPARALVRSGPGGSPAAASMTATSFDSCSTRRSVPAMASGIHGIKDSMSHGEFSAMRRSSSVHRRIDLSGHHRLRCSPAAARFGWPAGLAPPRTLDVRDWPTGAATLARYDLDRLCEWLSIDIAGRPRPWAPPRPPAVHGARALLRQRGTARWPRRRQRGNGGAGRARRCRAADIEGGGGRWPLATADRRVDASLPQPGPGGRDERAGRHSTGRRTFATRPHARRQEDQLVLVTVGDGDSARHRARPVAPVDASGRGSRLCRARQKPLQSFRRTTFSTAPSAACSCLAFALAVLKPGKLTVAVTTRTSCATAPDRNRAATRRHASSGALAHAWSSCPRGRACWRRSTPPHRHVISAEIAF